MISFRQAGSGATVLLLHGLFGMGINLRTISRGLSPYFSVYNLDLPDHGGSSWLANRDIRAYAEILIAWMDEIKLSNCHLVGHSLGGKVAMQMALIDPLRFDSLVVIDIAPINYPNSHQHIFHAMENLLVARCVSRKSAAETLDKHLGQIELTHFLSMSLRKNQKGIYKWIFNYEGLKRDYPLLCLAPDGKGATYHRPSLFIRGQLSDYVSGYGRTAIRDLFTKAEIVTVVGAGHWVHFDKPEELNSIVLQFLSEISDIV